MVAPIEMNTEGAAVLTCLLGITLWAFVTNVAVISDDLEYPKGRILPYFEHASLTKCSLCYHTRAEMEKTCLDKIARRYGLRDWRSDRLV